jgi:hypothetical protein
MYIISFGFPGATICGQIHVTNLFRVQKKHCLTRAAASAYLMSTVTQLILGPGSHPAQSVCDLWWTEWYWDMFFSEFLICFPVNNIPPSLSILIYHLGDEK